MTIPVAHSTNIRSISSVYVNGTRIEDEYILLSYYITPQQLSSRRVGALLNHTMK
jgi:hypothetical protein